MRRPIKPPKPWVSKRGEYWVLDTGHVDMPFDTWKDAMVHADRICKEYEKRLHLWVAGARSVRYRGLRNARLIIGNERARNDVQ